MITNRYQSSTTQLHFCNNAAAKCDLNHLHFRNGGGDEECGLPGRGAHRGGEEPAVGGVQERHRGKEGQLEDHLQHRAEGGTQGKRGQAGNDQKLP